MENTMRQKYPLILLLILIALVAFCGDSLAFDIKMPQISDEAKYTLANAANNIVKDLGGASGPFYILFVTFTYLAGLAMTFTGIKGLTRQDTPKGGAIAAIMIGVMLLSLPTLLNMFSQSIFDADAQSIISDVPTGTNKVSFTTKAFIHFAIFMVQVVGFVAVYRGLKTLADVSLTHQRQPEQVRAAWIYLFAGVLCINILGTIKLVAATAAGDSATEIMQWYNEVFGSINGNVTKP